MKPRIRYLRNGRWCCQSPGFTGFGWSPAAAYCGWLTLVEDNAIAAWR